MNKYTVAFNATYVRYVTVEALSEDDAINMVRVHLEQNKMPNSIIHSDSMTALYTFFEIDSHRRNCSNTRVIT